VDSLDWKGYEFVKISDLIYKDHYTMDVEGRQIPEA
jgi:diphthamide biosynthesis methyltransferase